ncbi:DNA-directed RNA polymerase specialized sigma subunit [Sporocytophaga myxococcoides]|uniref:DNA-directed RNA polymerase specialized sigma subunit n=1 Tax=Sporocytophaga myxococcoides TaxID=153721 RepID=A0A098LD89_9BACT|nr:sigma-70 family RNA polymerase sigma factor [Sporocytophaga myxococcoides]GAL84384.1 DNA-directed RNA polymerase specialized sigma subunit [Sporocytophaga myxococcoides]
MKISEEQIPDLIRNGKDKEVIPHLYKKVFPLVENYIRKNSGRKEDASDVFQDCLLLFYKQVIKNTFDPKYKVYGYLYRISINLWINKIKKEQRIQYLETVGDEAFEEEPSPWDRPQERTDENVIKSLFSGIGEKCVELLTNTVYYNLLMEDIMIRMGFSSIDAVKMQQKRCKQKLIKEIENNPALADKLKGI